MLGHESPSKDLKFIYSHSNFNKPIVTMDNTSAIISFFPDS
jgi:hypothetical protein